MKKEPKFRGKSVETDEWVYGCGWYHIDYTEEHKKENNMSERANLLTKSGFVECYLDSMGRYTELDDKYGTGVYGGDRVKDLHNKTFTVKYNDFYAFMLYDDDGEFMAMYPGIKIEVIGNIYENETRGM